MSTKISQSMHKMAEEDPTFKAHRDPATHELVVSGMSPLHLDVIQHRLKSRFGLEIITHEPKVAYRETIVRTGEANHISTRSSQADEASSAKCICGCSHSAARSPARSSARKSS
jgi:translation elongation factor EF-G